jgi:hypothetical protein
MKFNKVLEDIAATTTGDVQGIQGGMGVVRRKVGVSRTQISSVKNKKKKDKKTPKDKMDEVL